MVGFIRTSLQLQSVMTAHNQWLSRTRSIPYWTTSVFSSTVMNDEQRITELTWTTSVWRITRTNELQLPGDPNIGHHLRRFLWYSPVVTGVPLLIFVATGTCVCGFSTQQRMSHSWLRHLENVFNEALSSSGLFRHNIMAIAIFSSW
jgi:hypothetical protein